MTDQGRWIGQLEAEIARELGQTVALQAGGETPGSERSLLHVLEIPGARLTLAADREDLAALLVEGRLIEEGQEDPGLVEELWTGILASVAARLGGKLGEKPADGRLPASGQACALRLGGASLRMSLTVSEAAAGEAQPAGREAPSAEHPAPTRLAETAPPARPASREGNYDLLLEVELDAAVRFGSRELELKQLLELGPGDVVELDRHLADPVDLIVGDRIVARGEVVLVNGNFGLRVTEVAEPVRRLESIRCLS